MLAIFDLNGFKQYNDTFGHPAGDALLARLAGKLEAARCAGRAGVPHGRRRVLRAHPGLRAAAAARGRLAHRDGDSFAVSAAYGAVTIPLEAATSSEALGIADGRLYRQKGQIIARRSAAHEPLLRTLAEREPGLRAHVADVSTLVLEIASALGLAGIDLEELRLAAELHDVGKLAIPDAVLQKPGPLAEAEWDFIRQHTLIGQRILAGAPALAAVGTIVRSTHEHWDGSGYPDGLVGEAIPLPARIISVCDAYSAITSDRPYRTACSESQAIAELRRCAGRQFDPRLVEALCAVLEKRTSATPTVVALARRVSCRNSSQALVGTIRRPLHPWPALDHRTRPARGHSETSSGRVGPDDDRVGDRDDLRHGQVGAVGVLPDLLGARRLVDADGAEPSGLLCEYVTANPLDVVGHLFVADLGRASRGGFELRARPSSRHGE